ncbi:hypothetical protein niasHT_023930 [Heterodera trifolii]|uniref:Fucosyltransferase n=1 Tax=Heterodera trifolii TaxID=157864 RepID=A0ABD2JVG1_9BILA
MHLFYVLIAAALFNLHSFAKGQSSPEMFHSTDGKSGEKPIQYRTSAADNNNEQCNNNKPVGLTFNLTPKDAHCDDGLWICYLGILQQNIGISGSNFRAKRTFSVRDKNDMEIAKECAKKVATSASVADDGISNRWRGIKVYTKRTNGPNEGQKRDTIFETSIADKSFNIGTNLRKFFILFGDFHNGSFTTLSPAVAESHLSSEQHQLQTDFLDHQLQNGAFLADFGGLWLLGLDIVPMIKDSSQQQNVKLYIHSGCNCSMFIKSLNPLGPFTMVIEEKQCPSLPIDQAFSVGPTDRPSLPIDQTFSIGLTDRVPISVSFTALTDANINSMAVELLIASDDGNNRQIIRFDIGTDSDLTVNLESGMKNAFVSKDTRLSKGSYELKVEIELHPYYYVIIMNGTKMGIKYWPKKWWNEFQWFGVNQIKVHGPMKMIQAPVVRQFVNTIESPDKRPIILAWNNFFIWSIFDFVDLQFGDKNCSYSCVYTEDISFEKEASVVMWHTGDQLRDLPQHRRAEQLYVMMSHESPLLGSANFEKISYNFFNISITYRSDSAIHIPYDALAPVTAQTLPQYIWTEAEIQKRMALKKRSVVQFVSNCHVPSGRDLLTAQLQKLLQVDVYGKCNNRKCDDECYQREQESHFFYLAFENAVCTEYVTEKFWKALRNLMVPIVLSRKVMEEVGIPNGTFIAVDDFNSVKALADYLKELQKDTDKYMSYFKWTKTYQKHRSGNGIQPPLCQLCEIAHKQRHKDTFKTYAVQLDNFWPKTQCEPNFVQKRFKDL